MKKKIVSLNKELPEFFLEELEERLETDPLGVGSVIDLESTVSEAGCWGFSSCMPEAGCEKISCSWY